MILFHQMILYIKKNEEDFWKMYTLWNIKQLLKDKGDN